LELFDHAEAGSVDGRDAVFALLGAEQDHHGEE
jgi:hypothetical protein